LRTGSKEDPELRQKAEEMLDETRELRRKIDDLRISRLAEEKAKAKLNESV
jgi:hypothetical protein